MGGEVRPIHILYCFFGGKKKRALPFSDDGRPWSCKEEFQSETRLG